MYSNNVARFRTNEKKMPRHDRRGRHRYVPFNDFMEKNSGEPTSKPYERRRSSFDGPLKFTDPFKDSGGRTTTPKVLRSSVVEWYNLMVESAASALPSTGAIELFPDTDPTDAFAILLPMWEREKGQNLNNLVSVVRKYTAPKRDGRNGKTFLLEMRRKGVDDDIVDQYIAIHALRNCQRVSDIGLCIERLVASIDGFVLNHHRPSRSRINVMLWSDIRKQSPHLTAFFKPPVELKWLWRMFMQYRSERFSDDRSTVERLRVSRPEFKGMSTDQVLKIAVCDPRFDMNRSLDIQPTQPPLRRIDAEWERHRLRTLLGLGH